MLILLTLVITVLQYLVLSLRRLSQLCLHLSSCAAPLPLISSKVVLKLNLLLLCLLEGVLLRVVIACQSDACSFIYAHSNH